MSTHGMLSPGFLFDRLLPIPSIHFLHGPSNMMTAGGPSALLAPQQTKWELPFFSRPPISMFPSCRERRFLAGRPATGGTSHARFVTFAAVRPDASILTHLFASSAKTHLPTCFVSRPPAELGLLSLLFVVSMAMGAFLSVAVISLPTMNAFRRLAVSMENLSKVASEEVPGTLSSLKLSGLEINDLTQQLSGLRQRLTGKKGRNQRGSL